MMLAAHFSQTPGETGTRRLQRHHKHTHTHRNHHIIHNDTRARHANNQVIIALLVLTEHSKYFLQSSISYSFQKPIVHRQGFCMSVGGCIVQFLMHRPNHCTSDSHVLPNFSSKSKDIMLVTHNYSKCTLLTNKFQANSIKLSTPTYSHRTTAYFSNKHD